MPPARHHPHPSRGGRAVAARARAGLRGQERKAGTEREQTARAGTGGHATSRARAGGRGDSRLPPTRGARRGARANSSAQQRGAAAPGLRPRVSLGSATDCERSCGRRTDPCEGPPARPDRRPRSPPARTAGSPSRAGEPREGCAGSAGGKEGRGHGALPGLRRWRGRFALPPGLVREGAGPVAPPGGPEPSSAPAPRRPGQAAPPRRRAAARASRAASSSRAAPPRGPLSRGARLPSPARVPLSGRGAEGRAGRTSGGGRAGANAGSATRAAPLPQRRRRPGPRCGCQLVGRALSMRAPRPHPGNCRVWPFPPSALLSPGRPRLPPAVTGGRSAQAPAEESPPASQPHSRPGTRPLQGGAAPRWWARKAVRGECPLEKLASLRRKVPKKRGRARRVGSVQ